MVNNENNLNESQKQLIANSEKTVASTINSIDQINQVKAERIKNGIVFTFLASFGLLAGFGFSLGATKKQNSKKLNKKNFHRLQESGAELARRALLHATVYSVCGFSIFCIGVWKLSGASNFDEFRHKVGSILPKIGKKKEEQQGRTEFKNLTDLWHYLIEEDEKKKK
jgi:hypothetical protein